MNRYINASGLILTFIGVLTGCTVAQPVFYSYKVDSYFTGKSTNQFAASHVISCGDYVVEFNTKVKLDDSMIVRDGELWLAGQTVTFDTLSVYLLMPDGQYAEFDSFSVAGKLLKKGPMADKTNGIKRGAMSADTAAQSTAAPVPFALTEPKDTVINNVPCYYADIVRSKNTVLDTVGIQYFLVKKKQHFSSVYKMLGVKWKSNDYTIVGLRQYMYADGEGYIEKISNLRPLTTVERKICESLIQKAGLPLPR